MAVGAAVADALVDADALAAVNERGDRLRAGLQRPVRASPLPFCATGWGSLLDVHPVPGPSGRRPTSTTPTRAGASCSSTTCSTPASTSPHAATSP